MAGNYSGMPPGRGPKRKRKRLKDMEPFEVAIVPRGANRTTFVVMKEDRSMEFDLDKLSAAHGALGRIITVCKSGDPTPETVVSLQSDLHKIQGALGDFVTGSSVGGLDQVGIKTRLADISGIVDRLNEGSYDLNQQDKIDALQDQVKAIIEQVDVMPALPASGEVIPAATTAAPAAPAAAAATEGGDASATEDAAAAAAASGDAGATEGTAATSDATAADAGAAEGGDASGDAAAAEGDGAATDDGGADDGTGDDASADEGTADVVTKADLKTFGDQLAAGFADAVGKLETTLKSGGARPSILPPAAAGDDGVADAAADLADGEAEWGNQFDLNAEDGASE